MTRSETVAYIQAQTAAALIELQAMIVANREREMQNKALAYDETAFLELGERFVIHHNDVIGMFNQARGD